MVIPALDHNPAQVLQFFQRITAWENHRRGQPISKQTALKGAMRYLTLSVKIIVSRGGWVGFGSGELGWTHPMSRSCGVMFVGPRRGSECRFNVQKVNSSFKEGPCPAN